MRFDFVSRKDLKVALEGDLAELDRCAGVESWKAVHVLAGSIIEAILADYLISRGADEQNVLKLTLGGLVSRCRDEGILTEKTVSLSSAVKEYRNLIHPGRLTRLGEQVGAKTGKVAQALVEIVAAEIAQQKQQTYGLTAAQLVEKLESDITAIGILHHLTGDMHSHELEIFLLDAVPTRYQEIESNQAAQPALRSFEKAFRIVFSAADADIQKRVAERYVDMLRTDPDFVIASYENAFVDATLLQYLAPAQQGLVKSHFLSVLETAVSEETLNLVEGIGPYLAPSEAAAYLTPLVRSLTTSTDSGYTRLQKYIDDEYNRMTEPTKSALMQQLQQWVSRLRMITRESEAERLQDLKEYLELPF